MLINLGPKRQPAKITPSTRDLAQFISPNPKGVNQVQLFTETTNTNLKDAEASFAGFEAKNLSAFIIDTRNTTGLLPDDYLTKLREVLSCPIIRLDSATTEDEIFDSRVIQFDGQITTVDKLDQKTYFNLNKRATSIHFRLIPVMTTTASFEIVASATPNFIYLDDSFSDELPAIVKGSRTWLMGNESLKGRYPLKCVVSKL